MSAGYREPAHGECVVECDDALSPINRERAGVCSKEREWLRHTGNVCVAEGSEQVKEQIRSGTRRREIRLRLCWKLLYEAVAQVLQAKERTGW